MNADFRKVALIAAALGLIISLFFALRGGDDDETAQTTAAQTTTAQTTTEAPPATTETATTQSPPATTAQGTATIRINYVVVGGKPRGGIARDSIDQGRNVVISVTSDVADEVHVHGYDLMADVAPGAPATIRFKADAPGRFEIELENTGVQIAELEVRP